MSTIRFLPLALGPLALAFATSSIAPAQESAPPDAPVPADDGPLHVVSEDGTRIAYEREGEGDVVIFVAGALSTRSSGKETAALLTKDHVVIRYDRRGRGESREAQPHSLEREVEDIAALIAASGGKASLFGMSSGAVLALEAANRLGEKVEKAVLYEPPFVVDDSRAPIAADFVPRLRAMIAEDRRGDAVALFMTEAVEVPPEMVGAMRRSPMWPSLESLAPTLLDDLELFGETQDGTPLPEDRWTRVAAPILVVAGSASPVWMQNAAKEVHRVLPKSKLALLEGLDHSSPMTQPEPVAATLREFLAK
jgi:pimeloyl-ACP methyl ester carboxylesterase